MRDLRISDLEQKVRQLQEIKTENVVVWEVHQWEAIIKNKKKFLRSKTFSASGFSFFFGSEKRYLLLRFL